jgi:hypothetical protein
LKEIKEKHTNFSEFTSIEGYQTLFGIVINESGKKNKKIQHVYYCYTPENFTYEVYKQFITEKRDYEKKNGYELDKTYNQLKYEIYGNLCFYQLCNSKDRIYHFNKFEDLVYNYNY